ncbi:MAG TPA: copper chaperone PCu(A)C [Methylibium sp.]|uniref:copper chaperone PCu(A)C n=1 Tax=Methylibium sp. TaxID=2067992 RepID=UPI002DB5DB68|nr:copper chaperone PCu(A)C [Methylibium sp.]HEU4459615.1 copper chaperone PCu(A)C [Methylibium sp.]
MKTSAIKHLLVTSLGLAFAAAAAAHSFQAGDIQVGHPWARPTVAGQKGGGGFLKLTSKGKADRLIGASAAFAERVELHSMSMEGDVMKMRPVDAIDVPAGQTVELKPGGLHLMFIGLKQPLAKDSKVPLKLRFEKAGEVTVDVKVESQSSAAAEAAGAHKH